MLVEAITEKKNDEPKKRHRTRVITEEQINEAKRKGLVPQSGDWYKPKRWIRPEPEPCVHWWIIETSSGPTSIGECRKCLAKKRFFNSIVSGEKWGGLAGSGLRS